MGLELLLSKRDPARKAREVKQQGRNPIKETKKPNLVAESPKKPAPVSPDVKNSRYVRMTLKADVFRIHNSSCSFVNPVTDQVCDAKKFLEIDHRIPFSKGGKTELKNLQLLCDQHNRSLLYICGSNSRDKREDHSDN